MLPELRSERRWRREMRKLCSNALKEEPRQALPVDHRDTRRRNPSDESKSDHIQISPQPISLKAFKTRNRTTKSSISKSNPKPITTHILSLTLILLTRWSFRRMNAARRTDSSRRREAWRTLRRREKTPKSIKEERKGKIVASGSRLPETRRGDLEEGEEREELPRPTTEEEVAKADAIFGRDGAD